MLPLIFDTCLPRDEILSGDLSLDLFAAKLRLVVEGTAPQVDRDANKFFANTFATDGIKTLIREVFSRLISKTERIANIAEVILAMSNEEAHYWFGKIANGNRSNALKALGILWEIEIMKVADLTYLLVTRLCLVTHIRRFCLQLFPAKNKAEPRLHRFPARALEQLILLGS
jgi:hypothetical protein